MIDDMRKKFEIAFFGSNFKIDTDDNEYWYGNTQAKWVGYQAALLGITQPVNAIRKDALDQAIIAVQLRIPRSGRDNDTYRAFHAACTAILDFKNSGYAKAINAAMAEGGVK